MTRPARGTLAWKLYVLGLVQLVLLGFAVVEVGSLIRASRGHERPPPAFRGLTGELGALIDHPNELAQRLTELRESHSSEITIYDDARHVMTSNVEPPLDLPGPGPDRRPPHERSEVLPIVIGGRQWTLVGRHSHHEPPSPMAPLLTFFFSGVVILGIGSFLTARWIVRPLEDLTRAARALGAGDLRARAGLQRADELGEVGRSFDEMADRIQTLLLAEKELLANVSHELRTPLARIRVALDIAAEGDMETARVSLSEIGLDLSELEALIDDILTTTRLEIASGRTGAGFDLHKKTIEPSVIGERASERFRSRHPARRLEVTIAPDLPSIEADEVLLRRVIDNLLDNAHKYSPDADRPVRLRVRREGASVAFVIADQGIGIHEDDLPHVFTAFFRGERSRARGTGGVGLGLTLAKRIVEAHGGTIDVKSVAGAGTTVCVALRAL
jgi:signal transduction histidine kinase